MPEPPRKPSFRLTTGHTLPEAIAIAKSLTSQGFYHIGKPELSNEIAELGYHGDDGMVTALLKALNEITPEHYRPMKEPDHVPGIPFIWTSECFKTSMYLKFKLHGTKKKPVLWWYSCHPEMDKER